MDWLEKVEPSWGVIAQRMASEGVVGKKGEAPTRSSARKVWHRVCRDLEAEREREVDRSEAERVREIELLTGVPARKHYPRDFPKDWSPPLAERSEPARHSRDVMPLSSSAVATWSEGETSEGSRNAPAGEPETLVQLKEQLEVSNCGGESRFPRSGSLGMEIGNEERGIRRWIQRWRDPPKPSRRSGCPCWR
jgi:hypothetical protein